MIYKVEVSTQHTGEVIDVEAPSEYEALRKARVDFPGHMAQIWRR